MTRRVILDAARVRFAERGYSAVTVKDLAAAAGVSVQTIYDTYGSKAGVVMAFTDLVDTESGILEIVAQVPAVSEPRQLLALFARMRRQIRERCGDIVATLRTGAAADDDVAASWAEGMRRRHRGQRAAMERLAAAGALRPGLTADQAADIAAALAADEVCDVLVDQRGWSFDDYERWLAEAMADLLLTQQPKRGRRESGRSQP